ncbi:MAG: hypothetical protein JWO91_1354 [Acidobacteriaceae bacterium]|jgi:YfiR/HmsC-like|nr:hypothetical protein [Acidobacteriaceae bacterium]
MKFIEGTSRRSQTPRSCYLPTRFSLGLACKAGVLFVLCVLFGVSGLWAQTAKPTDYQTKAAYLYNFGKFVQWPPRATEAKDDPFGICVLGQNPFGTALQDLAGRTINGRTVASREIRKAQDAEKCHVLFVGASEQGRVSSILAALKKSPILTVSDMPHFAAHGGMIQFVVQDNKVRFVVNRGATERVGLSLSSELLKVALNMKLNQ